MVATKNLFGCITPVIVAKVWENWLTRRIFGLREVRQRVVKIVSEL